MKLTVNEDLDRMRVEAIVFCFKEMLLLPSVFWGNEENHKCLWVRSRSAQGPLTIRTKYCHGPVKVRSRSGQGSLTFRSRFAHGPLKVRSRSARGSLTAHSTSAYCSHKVRSRSAHRSLTVRYLILCIYVKASVRDRTVPWTWSLVWTQWPVLFWNVTARVNRVGRES